MPNAPSRWPSKEWRMSSLTSTSHPPGLPRCPIHCSNSGSAFGALTRSHMCEPFVVLYERRVRPATLGNIRFTAMVPPRGCPDRLQLYFGVRPALLRAPGCGFGSGLGPPLERVRESGRAVLTVRDFVLQFGPSPPWWGGRNGHGARKPEPRSETSPGAQNVGQGAAWPRRECVAYPRIQVRDDC